MRTTVKCPTCRKETQWQDNPYRPFCSARCRTTDLGAWADESYRVPGDKIASEESNEHEAAESKPRLPKT
ncbi:MAG: DNA gyrase inhibitor YacG [Deltaproteobacteria bacterium]|nr:DNA gyrase inhibitor YacG [Deltaproteobacteria bacterium]